VVLYATMGFRDFRPSVLVRDHIYASYLSAYGAQHIEIWELLQYLRADVVVLSCGAQKLYRTRIYALEGRVRRNKNVLQVSIH
jgi:hypothetical protein